MVTVLVLLAAGAVLHSASGGEQVSVVLVSVVLSIATIIVSSVLIGYRRYTQRAVLSALIAPAVCLSLIVSVALTHWPLRFGYAWSRDAFDALAQRVRVGEHIAVPVRVGLFTIRRAELSPQSIVCLWTYPHPGGSTGFVQCGRDYVPFNLWSLIRLDDRWQFISED